MIRLFMTVFSGVTCESIPAGNGLFLNKALRSRNILSLVIEILRRRPNVFWTFAAPRIKYASYRFSFITAIIATKIFLASPAVIAALSGLKPALWANAPASIICSVGFDSFSIILS